MCRASERRKLRRRRGARTTTRRKRRLLISLTSLPRAGAFALRADAAKISVRALRGGRTRGRSVPAMDARGEARVVRAAAGERERRRARMGWTSRAMRREGVVVGRGGSGVEVNNGGGVGAN